MLMVCESISEDVDFCDFLLFLGHMQDCGINQNFENLSYSTLLVFFCILPVIYSYASPLILMCVFFCVVVTKQCDISLQTIIIQYI